MAQDMARKQPLNPQQNTAKYLLNHRKNQQNEAKIEEEREFGEGEVREARLGYERREVVGGAIERSYFPGSFFSVSASTSGSSVNSGSSSCNCSFASCCCGNVFDVHSNGQQTHPVDVLAKVVEAEGIRQLLIMMKKKDLLFLCEQSNTDLIDKDDKRQIIHLLSEAWLLSTSKKFLKQIKGETPLILICKNLGLPYTPDRKSTVELILRQINVIGLEVFSKRLHDEQVKGYFIEKVHDQTEQIQRIAAEAVTVKQERKHRERRGRKKVSAEVESLSGSAEVRRTSGALGGSLDVGGVNRKKS